VIWYHNKSSFVKTVAKSVANTGSKLIKMPDFAAPILATPVFQEMKATIEAKQPT
jgi:hypothetical protein